MSQQSFISWIRQPASIILIIALLIMFLMMTDQTRQQKNTNSDKAASTSAVIPPMAAPSAAITMPGDMSAQPPQPTGGELPKIVQRLGGPSQGSPAASAPGRLTAPDLGSLLGRMEDKVKAEPNNISNRLLLAQTYNELGFIDKALSEVRAAAKQFPDHSRAKLVLASILSKRKNETELKEAVGILKGLRGNSEVKQYLVEMYLGDSWIRMGEHQSAKNSWKLALEGMPVSDNRRARIEKSIADLNLGKSDSGKSGT
jgi:predicted negative regulator of RcsB-dependent stress response